MDVKRWFKHDVSASEDVKLKTLCIRHPNGLGYAVFFAALELMAKQDDCAIGTDECTMITIADILKISDFERVVAVIADAEKYGLFKVDDARIYSERLRENMQVIQTNAAKRTAAGKKAAETRWNNAKIMRTQCERNANASKIDANAMRTHEKTMRTQCDSMRLDAIGCQDKEKDKDKENIKRSINTSMSFSDEKDLEVIIPEEVEDLEIDNNPREKNDYKAIVDMYNSICTSFPKVSKISEKRKKAINARLKSYTLAEIQNVFEIAEQSDFLKGANNRNWHADFDWMMCDSNIAKILEGKYNNKKQNHESNYQNIRFTNPGAAASTGSEPNPETTNPGSNWDWLDELPPIGQ